MGDAGSDPGVAADGDAERWGEPGPPTRLVPAVLGWLMTGICAMFGDDLGEGDEPRCIAEFISRVLKSLI